MGEAAAAPAGIGWRSPHHAELLQKRPRLPFVEVHSENFFGGGAAVALLERARAEWPVSLHGVGLSLGSACGVDEWHLEQLADLVQRVEPARVSDHASFARAPAWPVGPPGVGVTVMPGSGVVHGNDLLPVAFTHAQLDIFCGNVMAVQDRLQRTILIENLSAYLHWREADFGEAQFLAELCRRSGCGLLLDVNNLVVNALNAGEEPVAAACAFVDALPLGTVGEIHLAGYRDLGDIVIDDHGSRVHAPVWPVYRHALARFGAVPTLIEWDTDLPQLEVLLAEAALAGRHAAEVLAAGPRNPADATEVADRTRSAPGCA